MRILTPFLAFPLALLMTPFVVADSHGDCGSHGGRIELGTVEISPAGNPAVTFYVDDRNYLLGDGTWVYEETNGVFHDAQYGDLQRGGSSQIVPEDNEVCVDDCTCPPDLLIM